jgi:hypothetical protein
MSSFFDWIDSVRDCIAIGLLVIALLAVLLAKRGRRP